MQTSKPEIPSFLFFVHSWAVYTREEILSLSNVNKQAQVQEERAKVAEKLNKWKLEDIHRLMDMLDLARGSGTKVGPNPPVAPC